VEPFEERIARTELYMGKALATSRHIEASGLRVAQISGCGTGTHTITGRLPWMTELQCGSYATMDAQYAAVGGADYENALTVLVTVMSRPAPGRAVVDAGLKAVTPEFGDPTVLVEGASWLGFSEEHGELRLAGAAQELRVGDKIEVIPRHGCTTVNLYDRFHVLEDGALTAVWKVAARGRSQ
jgi:D-serine deaminase-like pyridoxal phosphate-dependent protein